jgi:hydrogenase maturation factor
MTNYQIKVKCRLSESEKPRALIVEDNVELEEFVERVCAKLGVDPDDVTLLFKDDEGDFVRLVDDEDWDAAKHLASETGKMEVVCTY